MLERHIREQIAQVVRISPSRISAQMPLGTLGLDSLMALECRNRLETSLGVTLSATVVWNYPTLSSLVPYLAGEMNIPLEDDAPRPQAPLKMVARASGTAQLAHLTEQEAEALLASELAAMELYSDEQPPEQH
jgi:acyl carrier protein